ncbi:MAG: hypothetical protein ACW99R_00470 [Candidatus Hodarchaeales archaeon]|jgi:hypothetical protein
MFFIKTYRRRYRRVSNVFLETILLLTVTLPFNDVLAPVSYETPEIDLETEIDEGFLNITQQIAYKYVWINANGAQILFLALVGFGGPSPVQVFVTEHYYSQNNSIEIFMGNQLNFIEFYHDNITEDGFPTGNYSIDGEHDEISHYLIFNASKSIQVFDVQKFKSDVGNTYIWGIRYSDIQALIIKSSSHPIQDIIDVNVSYIQFDYMYEIDLNENQTILKSSFQLGSFQGVNDLFFDNLSLSCLYSSFSHVSNTSSTYINGSTRYTSDNENVIIVMENLTQQVNQQEVWMNRFKSNFTVIDQNNSRDYPTVTTLAPLDSIDLNMRSSGHLNVIPLSNYLASLLPPIFTELRSIAWDESFSLENSLVRYRICYPEWGGHEIFHDPWITAQISPRNEIVLSPLFDRIHILSIGILTIGLFSFSLAVIRWKRLLKKTRV